MVLPRSCMSQAVRDDEQQARGLRRRKQFADQVKRKRIVPMKILEHHEPRPHLGLFQQETNDCLICFLAPLDKIEKPERMLVFQCVEKMQQWRYHVLQRGVERQDLFRHFLADGCGAVLGAYVEILPQQFDHRQVWCRALVGRGVGPQHQPVSCMLRMRELIDEARFAHTGFADDRHGLTMSARSNLLGAKELIKLSFAVWRDWQANYSPDVGM